ncbi:probable RNA-binding protein 19 [Anneissia japonica]|uniref:probable RNA-binding protein 19 n=1 Tax=Anneissia japonica TaxID=1529436 RepID=UPI0014255ABC|nr:probable RNA-binding protein 19 [Anneissia japonica]
MSRLVVKNLPKRVKEEKIKETFGKIGEITDLQLKYTKAGKFRQFAFVGYKSNAEAEKAVKFFNKTFLDSSRLQVELCKSIGDPDAVRPWSKYSSESSAYKKRQERLKTKTDGKPKKERDTKKTIDDNEEEEKEEKKDIELEEFIALHQKPNKSHVWGNDLVAGVTQKDPRQQKGERRPAPSGDHVMQDSDEVDSDSESEVDDTIKQDEVTEPIIEEDMKNKVALKKGLSDLDYLKSKVKQTSMSSSEDSESEDEKERNIVSNHQTAIAKIPNKSKTKTSEPTGQVFTIKMRGVPFTSKEKDIKTFFAPLAVSEVRIPKNSKGQKTGTVFVDLTSKADLEVAMKRNKDYMGSRYIELFVDDKNDRSKAQFTPQEPAWAKKAAELEEHGESIAETGRLFVRNLAYICKEEDLEELFSKYGPLTEVNLPIDSLTKKVKGFAFITYMMPEHAVKAFSELDGSIFMGRLLHILPGQEKKTEEDSFANEGSSYKKKKAGQQKALSGSSHNWNTLFIGSNAVADTMAAKYKTSKSEVLDPETKKSLAVRMALGETQIVAETRQFLLDNGVALDSFSQPAAARSKSVILVKNLPAGTSPAEIKEVFEKFGELGRLVLPPAGVSAIVEFLHTQEARKAFYNLAYTKFQHVPLYLEWAPVGVFNTPTPKIDEEEDTEKQAEAKSDKEKVTETKEEEKLEKEEESEESEDEPEPESTVFVKNLNFDTTDDTLLKVFSECGPVSVATVSKKKDMRNPGQFLSMGYGFVQYKRRSDAMKALKELQHTSIDSHTVEIKISNRTVLQKQSTSTRKTVKNKKQKSTKILIRNIPFEASRNEVKELFRTFGEIKAIRIPKKMSGTGGHRGFGFVDFLTKHDAKRAFEALCHSSHLYGRRLVLEWAEADDTVETLRKKTADRFLEGGPKKKLSRKTLLDELDG